MRLTLFAKGLILISIPLLFELGFIGLVAQMHWTNSRAQQRASQSRAVLLQAGAVLANMTDAETGIRGFILTGDPVFREPFDHAQQEVPEKVQHLQRLVEGNANQERKAQQVADTVGVALTWLDEARGSLRPGARGRARAQDREKLLEGKRLMDAVRREVAGVLEEAEREEAERLETLAASQTWLGRLFVAGGVMAFLTTTLLALLFRRGIGDRIATLVANTRRVAQGEALAPPLRGADEFTALDRVFHDMARALTESAQRERAYRANLERRVAERTAELAEANRDLLHKNQENELFVYSVSHDLRSPLVNLEGFSQELNLVCGDLRTLLRENDLPPAVRERGLTLVDQNVGEAIHFIQTAVRRLSGIIDVLLHLSRVGRVVYQRQMVDLNGVVKQVVEAMTATTTSRGARVVVKGLPAVWADPTAIEQVFANLIGNALNYLDPGRPGAIEVGGLAPGERGAPAGLQTCYVQDNGLGIPETCREKVFQPFQRIHPEVAGGEGMGLAIVRRIVDRHRGKVWIESRSGEGSTFFVALPAADTNSTADFELPAAAATPQAPLGSRGLPKGRRAHER